MSANELYNTWFKRIRQLIPSEHVSRIRSFAYMIVGIYLARSVHISQIACHIPTESKLTSTVMKLTRWLKNPKINVRQFDQPIAQLLIERVSVSRREIRLIIDSTKIGFSHQLLIVAIAYRKRAIPLGWTWVKSAKGHSSAIKQIALLRSIDSLLPPDKGVSLVGDSEFGSIEVLKVIDSFGWTYALRQKPNRFIQTDERLARRLDTLVNKPGESKWIKSALLTASHKYQTNFLAHWQLKEKQPGLLATNSTNKYHALEIYRQRMWLDEMFGDPKKHGFNVEQTHLIHFRRLSRLLLCVLWLYVWVIATGSDVIKRGQRGRVDRKSRRDLSRFRIGLYFIYTILAKGRLPDIRLVPYF